MPDPNTRGYEPYDDSVRGFVWIGIAAVALLVFGMIASAIVIRHSARAAESRQPAVSPLVSERTLPSPPRLQVNPKADMAELRRREDAVLGGYGWVDRQRGVVRIPIERAMELVVEDQR